MLKKINEGGVVGDNGFSIQITGPEELEYKYNNHLVKIDMGYDPKKKKIYIYADNIGQWDLPNKHKLISSDEKKNIINNIKEAVKLLKGNYEIA